MIGQTISHYRILEELGRGGMGVVYKAHDTKLDRPAALKVLKPELLEDEEHRQRFLREARSAAAVTHPYIASIYDAGEADKTLFIAMEFVEGQTLRALLGKGPMPIVDAQQYATEMAEGLAKAHQAGLVHRDMKPDNVMIASDGHAKILDFGLAKVVEKRDEAATLTLGKAERAEVTTQGAILGTPAYMSPEQARGEPVDSRSDIFSFGSTVYEMVTGKAPFQRTTHTDTLASILRDEPLSPHDSNPAVHSELSRIISRCLHKKSEDRYNDTRDLVAALKDLQAASGEQPSRRWGRILAGIVALVGVVALAVVQPWKLVRRDEQNVTSSAETPKRPNWILVADFDGPKDDLGMATAAQELVYSALGQSLVVTPIPRRDLKRGLVLSMRPDSTTIKGEVARELAFRAGARTYVEGRIDRVGSGYSLILRVVEAENGRIITALQDVAETENGIIVTLDRMGKELRDALGERSRDVEATAASAEVMTPSFAAYRKYMAARTLLGETENESCITLLRQALELDPDFASAWLLMASAYDNLGLLDSMRVAEQEAFKRPERLDESRRLGLEALKAWARADWPEVVRLRELFIVEQPFTVGNYNNLGAALGFLGRYEEAHRALLRAVEISPFEPSVVVLMNLFETLMVLGRRDDARAVIPRLGEPSKMEARLWLAMATSNWSIADSLASSMRERDDFGSRWRFRPKLALVSTMAVRGRMRSAARELEQLMLDAPSANWLHVTCFSRLFQHMVYPGPREVVLPEACSDSTVAGLILVGTCAVLNGQLEEAEQVRMVLNDKSLDERRRYLTDLELYDALLAASASHWRQVIDLIESARMGGQMADFTGKLPIRWLVAEAYENLGELAAATEGFELVLDDSRMQSRRLAQESLLRGIPYSFAHHRLVLLYSKMGRVEDARRHWEIFEKTFSNPDPELVPMIEEARQALETATPSM